MKKTSIFVRLCILLLTFSFALFVASFIEVEAINGIGNVKSTYSREILDNVIYTYVDSNNGNPQKNYVLEYDPINSGVEALAVYGKYEFGGDKLSTNVQLAREKGYTVIAGINASPFDTSNGVTSGTIIQDGRIVSANRGKSSHDSFAIREDGTMFIGTSNLDFCLTTKDNNNIIIHHINKQKKKQNNDIYLITSDYYTDTTTMESSCEIVLNVNSGMVKLNNKITCTVEEINQNTTRTKVEEGKVVLVGPSLESLGNLSVNDEVSISFNSLDKNYNWNDVKQSICGFYQILKDGNIINDSDPAVHPRTTVGFKNDGTIVFFVVDGRQPNFSIGLTDKACAEYMKSLGCVDAIRMDGGGSSTMCVRMPGDDFVTTVNSPSDGDERNDSDGLLLVLKDNYETNVGDGLKLHVYPNNIILLKNTITDITVKATDDNFNKKEVPNYNLEVLNECGIITEDLKFKAANDSKTGRIKVTSGNTFTYCDVVVTDSISEVFANVNNLSLSPNDVVDISVKAYYKGELVLCSNEAFTFSLDEGLGTIDEHGKFTATSTAGISGNIYISYGDITTKIVVNIGQLPVEITGFENDKVGSSLGQWQNKQVNGGSCSLSINTNLDYVRYGEKSLKINFDLSKTSGTVGSQVWTGERLTINGSPTAIGMWIYATASAKGAWIRMQYYSSETNGAKYADFGEIDWIGWKYCEAPIDTKVTYPVSIQYLVRIMAVNESQRVKGTIYVDQLRAVYGFKNDDFNKPTIEEMNPINNGIATTTETISFDAIDNESKVNKDKIKFFKDGDLLTNLNFKELENGYRVSWTPSALVPLEEGMHTFKVRVEDHAGNFTLKEWNILCDNDNANFEWLAKNEIKKEDEFLVDLKNTFSTNFSKLNIEMKFDHNNLRFIEVVENSNITITNIQCNNGVLKFDVEGGFESVDSAILSIKFKALKMGDAIIETTSFKVTNKKYNVIVDKLLEDVSFYIDSNFDYDNFELLINEINEEDLLTQREELNNLYNLMNEEKKETVKYLECVNKLEEMISLYNALANRSKALIDNLDIVAMKVGGR